MDTPQLSSLSAALVALNEAHNKIVLALADTEDHTGAYSSPEEKEIEKTIYEAGLAVCELQSKLTYAEGSMSDLLEEEDEEEPEEEPWDGFNSDAEADADALSSAGWGTDEDYGCFGE